MKERTEYLEPDPYPEELCSSCREMHPAAEVVKCDGMGGNCERMVCPLCRKKCAHCDKEGCKKCMVYDEEWFCGQCKEAYNWVIN